MNCKIDNLFTNFSIFTYSYYLKSKYLTTIDWRNTIKKQIKSP